MPPVTAPRWERLLPRGASNLAGIFLGAALTRPSSQELQPVSVLESEHHLVGSSGKPNRRGNPKSRSRTQRVLVRAATGILTAGAVILAATAFLSPAPGAKVSFTSGSIETDLSASAIRSVGAGAEMDAPLTFTAPPALIQPIDGSEISFESVTTETNSSQSPVQPITWQIAGICSATLPRFICLVTVTASNNATTSGFVTAHLTGPKGKQCTASGVLTKDSVAIRGSCPNGPIESARVDCSASGLRLRALWHPPTYPWANLAFGRTPSQDTLRWSIP